MKVYKCNIYEGELGGDEKTTPEWVEVSELDKLNTMPNVNSAVKNYLESINYE